MMSANVREVLLKSSGDGGDRSLIAQTLEAAWIAISHAPLLAVALNCALGPAELRPFVEELYSSTLRDWLADVLPSAPIR